MRGVSSWPLLGALAVLVGSGASASPVEAQITLDRFRPAELPSDGFQLRRPDALGHLAMGAQLHLDYANDPLVYELDLGDSDSEAARIVAHQLVATAHYALGLGDRVTVFAGLPVVLWMAGDDDTLGAAPADGAGLGDGSLGARVRILGEPGELLRLGAQATLTFPTGGGSYRGDDFLSFHPEVLFEVVPEWFRFTANVGYRIREDQRLQGDVLVGDELTFGLGFTVPVYGSHLAPHEDRVDLHAQLYGATMTGDFFSREGTPLEALAGAKLHHHTGVVTGFAMGAGLQRGVGSPDVRVVLMAGWQTPVEPPAEVEPVPDTEEEPEPAADRDADGVPDAVDECPDEPGPAAARGCPDVDSDGDGFVDREDACPYEAAPDTADGCPRVVVAEDQLRISERVHFEQDIAEVSARSHDLLRSVAQALAEHPEIRRVRIEGHADDTGDPEYNQRLSLSRAEAVRELLIEFGVDGGRLTAEGFGETRPVEANETHAGRAANRRVDFVIVERAPESPEE